MRSSEDIKKLIKNAKMRSDPEVNKAVLKDLMHQFDKTQKQESTVSLPKLRRTIMKNPITKLATAAVVITVVTLVLFEFIGDGGTSSVVWAEVASRVEASQGVIVRCIESIQSANENYSIKYLSPTHSRTDTYEGGQLTRSFYYDFDTRTFSGVFHTRKHYLIATFGEDSEGFLEKHEDWMNPGYLIETILSCKHSRLELKTIEGVLCEGIETTDPAFLGPLPEAVDRLEAQLRLWVDVKTKYPVLVEYKTSAEHNGEVMGDEGMMDQFQWDVEIDEGMFVPDIPTDYIDISPRK